MNNQQAKNKLIDEILLLNEKLEYQVGQGYDVQTLTTKCKSEINYYSLEKLKKLKNALTE